MCRNLRPALVTARLVMRQIGFMVPKLIGYARSRPGTSRTTSSHHFVRKDDAGAAHDGSIPELHQNRVVDSLAALREEIAAHPSNAWARELGYRPLFVAHPESRVLIIGQAPGRLAQDAGVPWSDASGRLLRSWLGVSDEQFYDPKNFAIVPMDFYYPGKAVSGDVPPRKDFADLWHPRVLPLLTEVRLTILIGTYAQRHYLGKATLTENVRTAATHLPIFPIVHPSPLARGWRTKNPWFDEVTVPLLRTEVARALELG
jgi:uracil-DNA glycosylase